MDYFGKGEMLTKTAFDRFVNNKRHGPFVGLFGEKKVLALWVKAHEKWMDEYIQYNLQFYTHLWIQIYGYIYGSIINHNHLNQSKWNNYIWLLFP